MEANTNVASQTITYNGKELTMEEIMKKMEELKALQGLQKEAKKKGLISKVKAPAKEKSASYALMVANFLPVIETNTELIAKLFTEHTGQDSISFDINKDYHVIIRSKAIVKGKQDERKAKEKALKEAEQKKKDRAAELAKEGKTPDEIKAIILVEFPPEVTDEADEDTEVEDAVKALDSKE